ncbi:MAG: phosphoglycerate mutase, partial [Actinomycetota bacterium]|nr:phosphoglycerate mutase [Actinomycetota bacterium]
MNVSRIWEELAQEEGGSIVLVVIDGVGGIGGEHSKMTELEAAQTPNLDLLAGESSCGLIEIVGPRITPGSGP